MQCCESYELATSANSDCETVADSLRRTSARRTCGVLRTELKSPMWLFQCCENAVRLLSACLRLIDFSKSLAKGTAMLVLGRKVGESIVIDGGIVVTVMEIKGERVRVGVHAPRDVTVLRAEVQDDRKDSK
jgi:carbon storage regulator CsrA